MKRNKRYEMSIKCKEDENIKTERTERRGFYSRNGSVKVILVTLLY